ncbi:DUF1080 domain-containing protein [bacterium]|nr:DUF1080 domain-containing protein [bacterium]
MKYTMIILTLFLMIKSTLAGTLTDDFNDGNMDEWTKVGKGNWKIKNGELIMSPLNSPFGFAIGEETWTDYTVSVRTKIVKHQLNLGWTEGTGLGLRYSPEWNIYFFGLATLGLGAKETLCFYMRGVWIGFHFERKPFDWKLDTWYHLKVVAAGEQFQFYVDDELVLDYKDNVHPKGQISIGGGYAKTTAHFDDFAVSGDDVPNLNYSVSPKGKLPTMWGKIKKL